MDEKTYGELIGADEDKVISDFMRLMDLGLVQEFDGKRCVFETMSNGVLRSINDLKEIELALKVADEVFSQKKDEADRILYAIMKTQDKYNEKEHLSFNAEAIFNCFREIKNGVMFVTRNGDAREIVSNVINKNLYDLNFEERVRTKAKVFLTERSFKDRVDKDWRPTWRFACISLEDIGFLIDVVHLNYKMIVELDKSIDLFKEKPINRNNFNYFPKVSLIYAISCMEQFISDKRKLENLSPSSLFHKNLDELKEIAYNLRTYVESVGKLPVLKKDANNKFSNLIEKDYLRVRAFDNDLSKVNETVFEDMNFNNSSVNGQGANSMSSFGREENPILDSASFGGNAVNKGSYNDDCVITAEHPSLNGVKLLVVADGVGGSENGYLASTLFSVDMHNWFNNLTVSDLQNNDVSVLLTNAIKASDRHIADVYSNMRPSPCTVASCILITNDNTYVSSVGDTRVYLEKSGQLNPIKRCENHLDKANKLGVDILFDDVETASRAPEGYIGYGSSKWYYCDPMVDVIPTASYDGILAVTDGVYKDVDDTNLNAIFEGCYSDDVAESICALAHHGEISPIYDNIGYHKTDAGLRLHDDASVAVYKKYAKVRTYEY